MSVSKRNRCHPLSSASCCTTTHPPHTQEKRRLELHIHISIEAINSNQSTRYRIFQRFQSQYRQWHANQRKTETITLYNSLPHSTHFTSTSSMNGLFKCKPKDAIIIIACLATNQSGFFEFYFGLKIFQFLWESLERKPKNTFNLFWEEI